MTPESFNQTGDLKDFVIHFSVDAMKHLSSVWQLKKLGIQLMFSCNLFPFFISNNDHGKQRLASYNRVFPCLDDSKI